MQQLAPTEYRAFRDIAVAEYGPEIVQRRIDDYAVQGVSLTWEGAMDEVAADKAGQLMDGGAVLDEFIRAHRENKPLLEKLRDAIRSFLAKLTGREKKKAQTAQGKLTAALEAAAKEAKTLQGQSDNGKMAAKYSLKDLTEEENTALTNYKSSESYKVNAKLRGEGELTPQDKVYVRHMDSALTKMPTHTGQVYRNITFDGMGDKAAFDAFMAEHEEGALVAYPAYTSTSTDVNGYPLEGRYVVHMVIEGHSGRNMTGVGNNFESEVLFERQNCFGISKVSRNEDGSVTIYMTEVSANEEADPGGNGSSENDSSGMPRRTETGHSDEKRSQTVQQMQEAGELHGDLSAVSEADSLRSSDGRGLPEIRGEGEAKHSLKTGTLTKSYSAILEENRLLREQTKDYLALQRRNRALEASRDYWQGQTRRSRQVTTDRKAVEKVETGLSTSWTGPRRVPRPGFVLYPKYSVNSASSSWSCRKGSCSPSFAEWMRSCSPEGDISTGKLPLTVMSRPDSSRWRSSPSIFQRPEQTSSSDWPSWLSHSSARPAAFSSPCSFKTQPEQPQTVSARPVSVGAAQSASPIPAGGSGALPGK